jgi:hypothetical protein
LLRGVSVDIEGATLKKLVPLEGSKLGSKIVGLEKGDWGIRMPACGGSLNSKHCGIGV